MARFRRAAKTGGYFLIELLPAVVLFLFAVAGIYRFAAAGELYVTRLRTAAHTHLEAKNQLMSSDIEHP